MYKHFLLLAAVISFGVALQSAAQRPAGGSGASAQSFAQLPPEAQTKAKSIYKIDCAMCHGDDGNGQSDLAGSMKLTMGNWTDG
ncbi:MAG TPA: c-type cytochrome [Terracidiphilus sp.]|nr:c-type cytochrome [Terracidiphilus sp.]